ncbi:MAG: ABC transporter permease [Phototrophicaceae bacterium]
MVSISANSPEHPQPMIRSGWRRFWDGSVGFLRGMVRYPLSLIGMLLVIGFVMLAFVGPMISPYPYDQVLRGEDRRTLKELPPSAAHWFGTDDKGRDVFSRVMTGARDTIGLPAVATLISVTLGTALGLALGYFGGWFDEWGSRALDTLLALPALVLALVMLTTIVPVLIELDNPFIERVGATNLSILLVIVVLYLPIVARVIRSATLNVRDRGFVEAARLRGEKAPYILFREILPSVLPALIVEASLRLSYAIFLVASLGFLGLGVQPPSPEWGRMVLDARDKLVTSPWALWFPAGAIVLFIISLNLMSDGLRRVLRYEG